MKKYLIILSVLLAVFLCGCTEKNWKMLYPGVIFRIDTNMHPYSFSIDNYDKSMKPIYLSYRGQVLKIDSGISSEEVKSFFENTLCAYSSYFSFELSFEGKALMEGESISAKQIPIELFFLVGQLVNVSIYFNLSDCEISMGTKPGVMFMFPLSIKNIEEMFGRDYIMQENYIHLWK